MLKKAWSDYWNSWSWKKFIKGNKSGMLSSVYFVCLPWIMLFINRDSVTNFTEEVTWCSCLMLYMVLITIAVFSQRCAILCLPKQMYLCPMTKNEREEYLKRLLQIKILVPFAFAFVGNVILAIMLQLRIELFFALLFSFLVSLLALNITVWQGGMQRVECREEKHKQIKGLVPFGVIALSFSMILQFIIIFAIELIDQRMIAFRIFVLIMILIQAIVAIGILSYTKSVIAIGCDYEYSLQGIDELNKAREELISGRSFGN